MKTEIEAGTEPCSCGGGDPFGFQVNGKECCLTCGGTLKKDNTGTGSDFAETLYDAISLPAKMITEGK